MHAYACVFWLLMTVGLYFTESLLVSAYTPARHEMIRNIPYLRTRCVAATGTPTISPMHRGGPFHKGGRVFPPVNRSDLVKRFKMSDAVARETCVIPHHVIKVPEIAVLKTPNALGDMEFRPWSIEWSLSLIHI